jgi:hypothetical protein
MNLHHFDDFGPSQTDHAIAGADVTKAIQLVLQSQTAWPVMPHNDVPVASYCLWIPSNLLRRSKIPRDDDKRPRIGCRNPRSKKQLPNSGTDKPVVVIVWTRLNERSY